MIRQAIIESLEQGSNLLEEISDDDYNTKLPLVYNATIGGHYRHILEHFSTLYESYCEGFVNYDLRKRNTEIETKREFALKATRNLKKTWSNLDESIFDQEITIQGKLSHKIEESMSLKTSVGREIAYSIAHAQHHYAIIGVMCALLNCPTAEGFGVAPSTEAHRKKNGETPLSTQS